jgi:cytochrome P450
MPVFGPAAMRDMFDGMHDVADQLLTRWKRFGEGAVIDVVDNMTRLTLDTIALCAMSYWVRTYQAIPRKIHARLEAAGATRIVERGEADARGDFFGDFDRWYEKLWSTLGETFGKASPALADGPLFEVVQSMATVPRTSLVLRLSMWVAL